VPPAPAFRRYALAYCAYLLGVILFGAWVRITGSGAGCGSHWPTCHGEVLPPSTARATLIEYSHRLTSGVLGVATLVLVVWAIARFRGGRPTRAALVTFGFVVFEALLGAGLVLQELVADNSSVARAVVVALHLLSTLLLTASGALVVYFAGESRPLRPRALGRRNALLAVGLTAMVLTCMTGAVTALGDTLFPVDGTSGMAVADRLRRELSPASHFLVRLRLVHPLVAVVGAAALWSVAEWLRAHAAEATTRRLAVALRHGVTTQVLLGLSNIWLAAPGWMQLVHLLVAQLLWMVAILSTASAWVGGLTSVSPGAPAPRPA
jgi:heme A synthase